MPFHESLLGGLLSAYTGGGSRPSLGEVTTRSNDYFGTGPGFDRGDIGDILGRIFGSDVVNPFDLDWAGRFPVPVPGGMGVEGGEEAAIRDLITGRLGGNGGNGGNGGTFSAGAGSSIRIAGNCAGLWHRTPVRIKYDPNTGEPRQVGGNERANAISLAQSDTGALQFFAPVKSKGWELVHKMRARHHHHRKRRVRRHHHHSDLPRARRSRVKASTRHHHHLTAKQLKAGFGGRAHM